MLRAGGCSNSFGIAVVAVALGVMSAGTSVPRAAGGGSQLERPGVSVIQAVPENETVGAGTHPEKFAPFEERYIFIERFGSFPVVKQRRASPQPRPRHPKCKPRRSQGIRACSESSMRCRVYRKKLIRQKIHCMREGQATDVDITFLEQPVSAPRYRLRN